MDGKRTNFDLRRRNLDDDYRPDNARALQLDSLQTGPVKEPARERYDGAFLAERGLLAPINSN
jgi:hypothetical protein